MVDNAAVLVLAPTLDTRAATALRSGLAGAAEAFPKIDGHAVEFLGAYALQILLSARIAGAPVKIAAPSQALVEQWRALGGPDDMLDNGETAA